MLAHIIDKPREFIIAHPEYQLSFWQWLKFKYYLHKRKNNYPIAYLIGSKEFYELEFEVNKNVLVPRPETELLVKKAIEEIKSNEENILLIDIGTGCGCIPISILKNTKLEQAIAIDISKKALTVAKKNAKRHKVKIDFRHGHLVEPVKSNINKNQNIIITANLPYVTKEQFKSEPSIQQEPKQSLVAEDGGLEYYKKLIEQIYEMKFDEKNIILFFEINPKQSEKIKKIIANYLTEAKIDIKTDLQKRERLIKVKYFS